MNMINTVMTLFDQSDWS